MDGEALKSARSGKVDRTFRRSVQRFEGDGVEGLIDYRLHQVSHRRAPVDDVIALTIPYTTRYSGWNVRHFYERYQHAGGRRSYTWVKSALQKEGAVKRGLGKGKHRISRGGTGILIVTMDDATHMHYAMFFVEQKVPPRVFGGCVK